MLIILKFIFNNIKEKKFRTFLILFSIIISSALFFASNAVSTTSMKILEDKLRQSTGNAEIMIQGGKHSPSPFFNIDQTNKLKDSVDYVVGAVKGMAIFKYSNDEYVTISLLGIGIDDLNLINPVKFFKSENLESFTGMKIIISQNTSEKYGLELGDIFKIEINGVAQRFRICGIGYPSGLFAEDGMTTAAVVPKETLSSIYNAKGAVNVAYIKSKADSDKNSIMGWLADTYKRYIVKEPFTQAEIDQQLGSTTISFMLMTIIVACISIFIIYSSFKVITMERLPIIGTFRSIGATKRMTNLVMLIESATYGVVGGLLGCGLGIGISYIITYFTSAEWDRIDGIKVYYNSGQLFQAFLMAIVLCFISSIIPILKISKIPLKDIIFNTIQFKEIKHPTRNTVLGIVLVASALLGPKVLYGSFVPKKISLMANLVFLVLPIVAVIILIPFITKGFVAVFERIYVFIFGNVGVLAAKNLKENKGLLSNISLLSIGIASLLMINALSYSISNAMTNVYSTAGFDIYMNVQESNKNFESLLKSIDGVKTVYMNYKFFGVEVSDRNDKIGVIEGLDKSKFLDYWDMDIVGDRKEIMEELDSGRYILISNTLKAKFNLNKGDTITLKMEQGDRDYKITGFLNTMMMGGNYALIAQRYLKLDMAASNANMIYLKTFKNPDDVRNEIKKRFAEMQPEIFTLEQLESTDRETYAQLLSILQGFSFITILIGIFGVLNNLIISFIERRRSFAMFRSVGMSRKQIVSMIFLESFTGGIIAGAIGVLTGLLLVNILPYILKTMDYTIPVTVSPDLLIGFIIGAIIIMMTASVSTALRSSKLNIIEAIKYE